MPPAGSAPTTPKWTGSLKSKKKTELQQLCFELGIEPKPDSLKADLEQEITKRFKSDPRLFDDARYEGLVFVSGPSSGSGAPNTSTQSSSGGGRSRRGRSVSRPRGDDDEQSNSSREFNDLLQGSTKQDSRLVTGSTRTTKASKQSQQEAPSKDVTKESGTARTALPTSPVSSPKLSTGLCELAERTTARAVDSFHAFGGYTNQFFAMILRYIQSALSSPASLCVLAIVGELAFVFGSIFPTRKENLIIPLAGGRPVPILDSVGLLLRHVLISQAFLRPFLHYALISVLLPVVLAGLMNFPKSSGTTPTPTTVGRDTVRKRQKAIGLSWSDLKPEIFTYNAIRLAVILLIHLVFYPTYHYGWANHPKLPHQVLTFSPRDQSENGSTSLVKLSFQNSSLHGFELVQFVGTTLGLIMSLHRVIISKQPTTSNSS